MAIMVVKLMPVMLEQEGMETMINQERRQVWQEDNQVKCVSQTFSVIDAANWAISQEAAKILKP